MFGMIPFERHENNMFDLFDNFERSFFGNSNSLTAFRTDIRDEFKECNVYAKPKCRECFARFYCSGGCAANAYNFHGDIHEAYDVGCALQKKRIECAIMIKAATAVE